ncbi:MAG: hypothetical protein LWX56_00465 [Ignavibacteria bacterium]|nr:hypothetical protein [Ignavibacteria bacterium]
MDLVKIILFAFWGIIVIAALFNKLKAKPAAEPIEPDSFHPSDTNDKLVKVKGWTYDELNKIINDFINLYKDSEYPQAKIEITELGTSFYKLLFPQDIHPMLFTFLINYLVYPFEMDLKRHSIVVVGQATLNADYTGINDTEFGQKATFYIPEHDSEHDVVFLNDEKGRVFENSFTDCRWKSGNSDRLSEEAKKMLIES